jgi:hypothetical protein
MRFYGRSNLNNLITTVSQPAICKHIQLLLIQLGLNHTALLTTQLYYHTFKPENIN